jgi:hypothetical protein
MMPSDDTVRGSSRELLDLSPQAHLFPCSLIFFISRHLDLAYLEWLSSSVFIPRESREDCFFLSKAPPSTLKQILVKNGVLEWILRVLGDWTCLNVKQAHPVEDSYQFQYHHAAHDFSWNRRDWILFFLWMRVIDCNALPSTNADWSFSFENPFPRACYNHWVLSLKLYDTCRVLFCVESVGVCFGCLLLLRRHPTSTSFTHLQTVLKRS